MARLSHVVRKCMFFRESTLEIDHSTDCSKGFKGPPLESKIVPTRYRWSHLPSCMRTASCCIEAGIGNMAFILKLVIRSPKRKLYITIPHIGGLIQTEEV